jgi:hypothetical protein
VSSTDQIALLEGTRGRLLAQKMQLEKKIGELKGISSSARDEKKEFQSYIWSRFTFVCGVTHERHRRGSPFRPRWPVARNRPSEVELIGQASAPRRAPLGPWVILEGKGDPQDPRRVPSFKVDKQMGALPEQKRAEVSGGSLVTDRAGGNYYCDYTIRYEKKVPPLRF